ncbi:hypothetical protein CBM2633_B60005 [Cupriavidus taiwanensis]|nr:hypothetical protein CBM2633_B60005 [Cupriavidus taiwanensis]
MGHPGGGRIFRGAHERSLDASVPEHAFSFNENPPQKFDGAVRGDSNADERTAPAGAGGRGVLSAVGAGGRRGGISGAAAGAARAGRVPYPTFFEGEPWSFACGTSRIPGRATRATPRIRP